MSREGTRGYGRIARECDGVENNVAGRDKDRGIRGQGNGVSSLTDTQTRLFFGY